MQGGCHIERCLEPNEEKSDVVELYYDFQKAYDTVNHAFLEKLLKVYCFPQGVQMLITEMMARWRIRLS